MIPTEVPQFLKAYGFEELTLTNQDSSKKSYTFKFHTYNHNRLVKELGAPSITSDKKTAIFTIPKVGKLGVAPASRVVRFIDASPTDFGVPSNHLSIKETTKELDFAYIKAQTTPRLRLAFLKKAYEYFNKEKFHDALKPCVLSVSASPPKNSSSPKLKGARGIYYGGVGGPQGTLWIADFLFNSPAPFFNEVLVHEMCITGDSWVSTEQGAVRMDQLASSGAKCVRSRAGLSRLSKVWESGTKPTLLVKTQSGNSLRLTGNHPVLVHKWYGNKWVDADRLKAGDKVLRLIE
jgi:hypothetical protein